MVEFPVSANLTGTTEPTDSLSLLAVVVSMSSSWAARAGAPDPASIRKMTVAARSWGETAVTFDSECRNSNSPL